MAPVIVNITRAVMNTRQAPIAGRFSLWRVNLKRLSAPWRVNVHSLQNSNEIKCLLQLHFICKIYGMMAMDMTQLLCLRDGN